MSDDKESKKGEYNFTWVGLIGAAGATFVGWGTNERIGIGVFLLFMATVTAIVQGLKDR